MKTEIAENRRNTGLNRSEIRTCRISVFEVQSLPTLAISAVALNETNSTQVHFGPFDFDLHSLQLNKRGHRLSLGPQPGKVLATLAERPGMLVTREELHEAVWGKDTFVDFDQGLNACIRRIRAVLGDDAETPKYIETVPRHGYRFIAPVRNGASSNAAVEAQASVLSTTAPIGKGEASRLRARWNTLAAVTLTFAVIAGTGVILWRSRVSYKEPVQQVLTANSSESPVTGAAISPDGRYLAYSDSTGLYLKLISNGELQSVNASGCGEAEMNSWFPDGTHIVVSCSTRAPDRRGVWAVSALGGSAHQLIEDGWGSAVSPDGSRIAFLRGIPGRELWVMRADGSEVSKIAAEEPLVRLASPVWSPDGRQIAYRKTVWGYLSSTQSIEVWQKGGARTLLSDPRLNDGLYWLSSNDLLYSTAEEMPNEWRSSLWKVKVLPGKPANPKFIATLAGLTASIAASLDGKVSALRQVTWQEQVFVGTLSRSGTALTAYRRLTLDENVNIPFAWTPDSKAVLFSSNRTGRYGIFRQALDRSIAETVVGGKDLAHISRLSPDGSELLYLSVAHDASSGTPAAILAIPLQGGTPRVVLRKSGIANLQCARLPATTCVYSAVQDKQFVIYSFDYRNGNESELTRINANEGNISWSLSPDGRTIAIISHPRAEALIQLFSIGNHKVKDLPVKGWSGLFNLDWNADGDGLFVTTVDGSRLLSVDLNGNAHPLLTKTHEQIEWAIPSPNGRSVAVAESGGTSNVIALKSATPR